MVSQRYWRSAGVTRTTGARNFIYMTITGDTRKAAGVQKFIQKGQFLLPLFACGTKVDGVSMINFCRYDMRLSGKVHTIVSASKTVLFTACLAIALGWHLALLDLCGLTHNIPLDGNEVRLG